MRAELAPMPHLHRSSVPHRLVVQNMNSSVVIAAHPETHEQAHVPQVVPALYADSRCLLADALEWLGNGDPRRVLELLLCAVWLRWKPLHVEWKRLAGSACLAPNPAQRPTLGLLSGSG